MADAPLPALFVDWTATEAVLRQAVDDGGAGVGVQCCALMQADGSLLCVAGALSSARLLSALAATVYASYNSAEAFGGGGELQQLHIHCDAGAVAVARLSRFLLAVQADHATQPGQLKHVVHALCDHLAPLRSVYPDADG